MYKAAGCGHTMDCEGGPAPTATTERSIHTMENRSENPNQYTKGADDESAKNSTNSRSTNAKNSR